MTTLGVDTSNYATSLAVVNTTANEVVCAKKRFLPVKEGQLGLRQSDAVFQHTLALPSLLNEMVEEGINLSQIEAVGVSSLPRAQEGSYMPCFLAGVAFANAFAAGAGVPIAQTSHQEGHISAAFFGAKKQELAKGQNLVFHISGGTTELLLTKGYHPEKILGSSLDLYAGQAVDRLGVKLGFPFPAGAEISKLATGCREKITPKITMKGLDCCFSGLQNQCEKLLSDGKPPEYAAKYCLITIAETVCAMVKQARKIYPGLPVLCAGGVMSSTVIKEYVENAIEQAYFVPPVFASDNAVGVALIAAKESN